MPANTPTRTPFDIDGLTAHQQDELLNLLWGYVCQDRMHADRCVTGYGTKTREGLLRSIATIVRGDDDAS